MIEQFTNRYSLSRTLRFSLLPVGKTEENFNNNFLSEDEKRSENCKKVKGYMDEYHKAFIEDVLNKTKIDSLNEYSSLYFKPNKSDEDMLALEKLEAEMRKQISASFTKDSNYKSINNKEFITKLLPEFLEDDEGKDIVSQFNTFSTYFKGFFDNRKNMYTEKEQSTAISYRCINDNLPKFLDNVKSFEKVSKSLSPDNFCEINKNINGLFGVKVEEVFTVDYFNFVLSQSGIDRYNQIIGGYSNDDGSKVKGLNEYINLFNQQVAKNDKGRRLPLMRTLFKQILSDRDSASFIPEAFNNDNEVLTSINDLYSDKEFGIENKIEKLNTLFSDLNNYDINGIYISNGSAITELSKAAFGDWNLIRDCWKKQYEAENPIKKGKSEEKYYDNEDKAYKKIKSFSINDLEKLVGKPNSIVGYYSNVLKELASSVKEKYEPIKSLLSNEYKDSKKLSNNDKAIGAIKAFLDSIKSLEKLLKPLNGSGKEEFKDNEFYEKFSSLLTNICNVDGLYNKVRNYATKKPYSTEKLKLNFNSPTLLNGWDLNKEQQDLGVLLKKDENYYLGIINPNSRKILVNTECDTENNCYKKMEYKLLPGPDKMLPKVFFSKSRKEEFSPSDELLSKYKKGYHKKGINFDLEFCHELINFYKEAINKNEDWEKFKFNFKDTNEYNDIGEFYKDVKRQGYKIKFKNYSYEYINSLVEKGDLYLFQIYNKDFSEYSKGTPNLHTLYFKMLFDDENLKDVVYKLSGGAEMFYRKKSIEDAEKTVHKANQPIDNKNPDNSKKQSTFSYDLIKDKRFTKPQFSLHIPIEMNFKADGNEIINEDVKKALKSSEKNYVIGIDRGERNLIYICVIDSDGKIKEQRSLNEIISNGYNVNYQQLLDNKESERDKARKQWKEIGTIKELKEGYISQAVHEICKLVIEYDAIIAMENLSSGFMNSRKKVEKQVYQKFEKMLTDKLNYLVDKKLSPKETGGLLNAYQLTNKAGKSLKGYQNGIIFYIPAWLTSKIDPTTGFASLLKPKYTSVEAAREFIKRFDDIRYNSNENYFEFDIDYNKFPKCNADFKKKWTVCSNADRIKTFINPEKNNKWDNQTVILTDEFKNLFERYGIDYSASLKESIISQDKKEFFKALIHLLSLTLQMRNSNADVDYLISPVKNSNGEFYDSRNYNTPDSQLPADADANGAYNIARKGLWAVNQIKDDVKNLSISNADWLKYAQNI